VTDSRVPSTKAKCLAAEMSPRGFRFASREGAGPRVIGSWQDRSKIGDGAFGEAVATHTDSLRWSSLDRVRIVTPLVQTDQGTELFVPDGWSYTDPRVLDLVGSEDAVEVRSVADWQMRYVSGMPRTHLNPSVGEGLVPSWAFMVVNSPGQNCLVPAGGTPVPLEAVDLAQIMAIEFEQEIFRRVTARVGDQWGTAPFDVVYQVIAKFFGREVMTGLTPHNVLQLALRTVRVQGRPQHEEDCRMAGSMCMQSLCNLAIHLTDTNDSVAGIALGGHFGNVLTEIFKASPFLREFAKGSDRRQAMNVWLAKPDTAIEQAVGEPID